VHAVGDALMRVCRGSLNVHILRFGRGTGLAVNDVLCFRRFHETLPYPSATMHNSRAPTSLTGEYALCTKRRDAERRLLRQPCGS
jgi:hypothetical protein